MSQPNRRRIDLMLDPGYLDGLAERPIDEVREMHEECLDVETEVSYVRRLAQARMEIVNAELDRRERGGSVSELVAMLPQILADDHPRPDPASSRLPQKLAPSLRTEERRAPESLVADATLVNLPTIPADELRATLEQLAQLERDVSRRRRAMHAVIDTIKADLTARLQVDNA
jgi:hypothetical protein